MITINLTITIDETKLPTSNYSTEQIVETVKNEILSILNYEQPDIANLILNRVDDKFNEHLSKRGLPIDGYPLQAE